MVHRGVAAGLGVAAVLALGALLGRAPILKPAAAQAPRVRQVVSAGDAFSFAVLLPPGGRFVFDRPPAGQVYLVTDVLVQNLPVVGDLRAVPGDDFLGRSLVTVGTSARQITSFDRRVLGGGLKVWVIGSKLEQIHLETGFVPEDMAAISDEPVLVANDAVSTATAYVQVYGRLVPIAAP